MKIITLLMCICIPPIFVFLAIEKMVSIIPLNNYSLDEDDHPIYVYSIK